MTTDLAAALLRDVPTRYQPVNGDRLLHESDVLAALSAHLDADLAERAAGRAQFCRDRGEIKSPEIIEALLVQNAALRAERDKEAKAHEKEIYVWSENYAGLERKLSAAAIRELEARVERLTKLDAEYGRVEEAIIFADPDFDGDSNHANCGDRLIASVERIKARANAAEAKLAGVTAERDKLEIDLATVLAREANSFMRHDAKMQAAEATVATLTAQVEAMRGALEKLACKCSSNCDWERDDVCPSWIARVALTTENHDG